MNATTLSLSDAQTTPWLDRVTTALLLAFVATVQVSIVAAQALLVLLLLAWVATLVRDKTRPTAPRFFWLLLAYAAVTLVSSAFSVDPIESFIDSQQLYLFLIVPVVYDLARGRRTKTVMDVVITVGALAAAYGIIQYGMLHFDSLRLRPRGTMGHYMTYSGTLMLVIGAAAARLVFGVARSTVAGARHAGARRRAHAHVHAQRVGRRLRGRQPAVHPQGLPPDRR